MATAVGRFAPMKTGLVLLGSLVAAGCASSPTVKYWTNPTHDDKGYIKFFLADTDITLVPATAGGGGGADAGVADRVRTSPEDLTAVAIALSPKGVGAQLQEKVKAIATPTEDRSALYAVVPETGWLGAVRTTLSVEYASSAGTTKLVKKLGSEVTDERAKLISALGVAATALVPAFTAFSEPPSEEKKETLLLPVTIEARLAKDGQWRTLPRNGAHWAYRLVEDAESTRRVQEAAVTPADFFKAYSHPEGQSTSVFPFSSCKAVKLQLRYSAEDPLTGQSAPDAQFGLLIADPEHIDTLALPSKGSIAMHPVCGADVVNDSGGQSPGAWTLLEALMNQVKAVKDAQQKKKP